MDAAWRGYDEIIDILLTEKANVKHKDMVSVYMCCKFYLDCAGVCVTVDHVMYEKLYY